MYIPMNFQHETVVEISSATPRTRLLDYWITEYTFLELRQQSGEDRLYDTHENAEVVFGK